MDERRKTSTAESVRDVEAGQRRVPLAVLISLAVHGAIVAYGASLPTTRSMVEALRGDVEIEFTPSTLEADPLPPETLPPEPTAPLPEQPRHVDSTPSSSAEPSATELAPGAVGTPSGGVESPLGPPIALPTVGSETPAGPIDPTERQRLAALVAPGRVASSFVVESAPGGPSQASGPAGLAVTGGRPTIRGEAEVEQSLSGGLRRQAMDRPWTTRTHPELVQRPDGTLEYRGHAFTARIAQDGSVRFSDRGGIQADEMLQGGPARFDLTDLAMQGRGQDPYAAERQWFMDETEEVRERLETAAREQERTQALQRAPGRIAQIWSGASPAFVRRRRLFQEWDSCEEEGDGVTVRRQIVQFIRENLPSGSADAFTTEELRRFNAERESHAEFDPY